MAEESCASGCSKESCEGCPSNKGTASFLEEPNMFTQVKHIIGVVSGKGGVGKSFTTASLANGLQAKGYQVGIMDADITGPSIPRMYGLNKNAKGDDQGIYPEITENGIKVISMNLLLENEDAPAIWRGPVIAGVVKQFWTDVIWGELDYLLVDMPPGTGDVPLTIFQSLPLSGIVIVTSPQDLVRMIVKKAFNMAGMMNIPVLGLIENYSWLKCPDCGTEIPIFGKSKIKEAAAEFGVPVLGQIPLETKNAQLADSGSFAEVQNTYLADAVSALATIKIK